MKFSNGCWTDRKEGLTPAFHRTEVYFTKIEKDKVVLCATDNIRLITEEIHWAESSLTVESYHSDAGSNPCKDVSL